MEKITTKQTKQLQNKQQQKNNRKVHIVIYTKANTDFELLCNSFLCKSQLRVLNIAVKIHVV